MRIERAAPACARGLGGRRGAARLTANFPPIEDVKANFFGAHGNVVSGAISLTAGDGPNTLLELAEATIVVTAAVDPDHGATVTVHNNTTAPLLGAQDLDGAVTELSLDAHAESEIRLAAAGSGIHRLHLQIFPDRPQFPNVVTLLVSSEDAGSVVGQAFVSAV